MLETWHIDAASSSQALPASSVALLLEAPHNAEPAAKMLDFLNAMVPVDYLSLVEYVSQGGVAAPALVEGHAGDRQRSQVTADCFALYRKHFWREDQGTQIAQHLNRSQAASTPVTALHFSAGDILVDSWRTSIYDRANLADRLSFFYSPVPGSAFAINLYRDNAQGPFQPSEIQRLLGVAPLLKQTHRGALRSGPAEAQGQPLASRIAAAESALRRKLPELSPRELAVCARIACGISADGIAADLDVAPSTVITLRKRAYTKFAGRGIMAGRLQLAALVRR
jgi:DNA-binding CsgD family transcriptional regulator